jgi:hypothetical protein
VLTPRVQPRRDGIHLRFYTPSDRWNAFQLVNDDGDNEGGRFRGYRFENLSTFPPGPLYVGCFESLYDAPLYPREPAYSKLTIVDPFGLWTEPEPDCPVPDKRPMIVPGNPSDPEPDYEALMREHASGLEPGDVFERPMYPESEFIFETRTVVRDGRRVASLTFSPRAGSWVITVWACPGSGIAHEQRF